MALPHGQTKGRQMNLNTVLLAIVIGLGTWGLRSINGVQADVASIKVFEQAEKERTDSLALDIKSHDDRLRVLEMMPHGPPPYRRGTEGAN